MSEVRNRHGPMSPETDEIKHHKLKKSPLFTSETSHSNRHSNRLDFDTKETHELGETTPTKGSDSTYYSQVVNRTPGAEGKKKSNSNTRTLTNGKLDERTKGTIRHTRRILEEIEQMLSARDHAVLMALRKYRFLTSDQIGRLYVTQYTTVTAQTRNRNLLLKRLREHGLIQPLDRRIGGFGGGSTMQVWRLTEVGYRILTLNDAGTTPRKRFTEPSTQFLLHTLAVAECAVQMVTLCRESLDLSLDQLDTEPPCWRCYEEGGVINYLKPDLFAITNYDDYEDRWFIEIDLGTESPMQIVQKCNAYLKYYYTGIEQEDTGMFPLVVFIVNDEKRKNTLKDYIKENIKGHPKMFLVILPHELEKTLRQFTDPRELI